MNACSAKERLDLIIKKSRVDLYKPIQVAETLRHSRLHKDVDFSSLESYRTRSRHWRNDVTRRLLGKVCTSSARFQDDIWNDNAFPTSIITTLNEENLRTDGAVERYIYFKFQERQKTVGSIISYINSSSRQVFHLERLLELFVQSPGIKRSIDKAYEIVTHSLLETVVCSLEAKVTVKVPSHRHGILMEFEDLARVLLGVDSENPSNTIDAHLYRVGVTNAADRGLDMWANFGPAVQVKHLTIDPDKANAIVDQIESDYVVVVCESSDKAVIETIAKQIGWGRRVRGIITEKDLLRWYEKCLRGRFENELGDQLLDRLKQGFLAEFPHIQELSDFLAERSYTEMAISSPWNA